MGKVLIVGDEAGFRAYLDEIISKAAEITVNRTSGRIIIDGTSYIHVTRLEQMRGHSDTPVVFVDGASSLSEYMKIWHHAKALLARRMPTLVGKYSADMREVALQGESEIHSESEPSAVEFVLSLNPFPARAKPRATTKAITGKAVHKRVKKY
jgi:hypothetical protein